MGWGYGVLSNGKEVGYTVTATCEHEGCDCEIDRGLSDACGGMSGEDEYSCDGFFCEEHLQNYLLTLQEDYIRVCDKCKELHISSGEYIYDENEDCLVRGDDGN